MNLNIVQFGGIRWESIDSEKTSLICGQIKQMNKGDNEEECGQISGIMALKRILKE